jgi:hypothetical protein
MVPSQTTSSGLSVYLTKPLQDNDLLFDPT